MESLPSLFLTIVNTTDTFKIDKEYDGYQIEITPSEYVYGTTDADNKFTFVELLVGDLSSAINSNACPDDSTIGIGNLFHLKNNVNYIQNKNTADPKNPVITLQLGIYAPTLKKVKVRKEFKNLVILLGLGSVVLFFFAILICKSLSPKLEKVEHSGKAPHATIGNSSEGEGYAKQEEEDSG
jgi:hypothetical protein